MGKASLGNRMKRYEMVSSNSLTRRTPAIIRIDGKAFHSFTKGMNRPFDPVFRNAMAETMKELCQGIQGCVFGYTQSDEISLLLTDYSTLDTDAWFGYEVQKMCSIAASTATLSFNINFIDQANAAQQFYDTEASIEGCMKFDYSVYERRFNKANFDARVFSLPKEEVCNYFIWRQQDATRNSIQSAGQAYFSHHELQGKNQTDIQEMLWSTQNLNWNDYPVWYKRGVTCYKTPQNIDKKTTRMKWVIDDKPPIFSQDRTHVEAWI